MLRLLIHMNYETKHQISINKRESLGLKYYKDFKVFIEYSNDMRDIYENIEKCNLNKEGKILTVFDNMIGDMFSNNKHSNRIIYKRQKTKNFS